MRKFNGYKKGVNLGGWLSQCGAGNYNAAHYDTFITEKDIERIASWGVDHVRLPVDFHLFQNIDFTFNESGLEYIDRCIGWCGKYGLDMVLDLHKTMGYIFDDKAYCRFFFGESLQDNFVRVWEMLTRRYGQYSSRVSFELLNEITERKFAKKWNKISHRTIDAIRAINKDVKIIIGGIYNSSIDGLELLEKPADENIVFTFHCYSPMIFTHQGAEWVDKMPSDIRVNYPKKISGLKRQSHDVFGGDFDGEFIDSETLIGTGFFERLLEKAIAIGEKYDVPLYCGEYGVIDTASAEDTVKWFEDINAAFTHCNIPRCVWTYRSMNFGIADEHYAGILHDLIKLL
ncbi:MAG: glycoside hydrolase family 5 protein [Oscillospiraceae bacterium]|nr:glycoside hydrolase family 5 protein [Oscillospiraceae bacterium]